MQVMYTTYTFYAHSKIYPHLCTPVCRLCGRYLAILGRPIRTTVPSVTVAPMALVGSLIRSSKLPHSLQRGVHSEMNISLKEYRWSRQEPSSAIYHHTCPRGDGASVRYGCPWSGVRPHTSCTGTRPGCRRRTPPL